MDVRKKYYPCYNKSEREFIYQYLKTPIIIRIFRKYERNFWISIIKKIYRHIGVIYIDTYRYHQLPINWNKQEIIASLKREYQSEITHAKYLFAKDIPIKEHEQLKQESQRKLKIEYKYLLDLIEEIKGY